MIDAFAIPKADFKAVVAPAVAAAQAILKVVDKRVGRRQPALLEEAIGELGGMATEATDDNHVGWRKIE
jgi:hypothetical protein